jgi:hypothetical protein
VFSRALDLLSLLLLAEKLLSAYTGTLALREKAIPAYLPTKIR